MPRGVFLFRGRAEERDRQILSGIRDGQTNQQIAARIGLAPHSVRIYVSQLYARLEAGTRPHLVSIAIQQGLIPPTQKKARTA